MSDEKELLAAIWEHPHDDTVRLVYADWLQETGVPANVARAEFIRLQCGLAKLEWDDPARTASQLRSEKLQKKYGGGWKAGLPHSLRSVRYWRGFPQPSRTVRASDLDTIPASEWNAVPLWSVSLAQHTADVLTKLAASANLVRFGSLQLNPGRRGKSLDPDGATALMRSSYLRNISELNFTSTALRMQTLDALFRSPSLRNLCDLSFCACGLSGDLVRLLMESAIPEQLTCLDLQGNHMAHRELEMFFEGAGRFGRLVSLGLVAPRAPLLPLAFASFSPLPVLRSLYTNTRSDHLIALANWPGLATLQVLSLHGGPGLGPAEARALVSSPHIRNLRRLSCAFASGSRQETIDLMKSRFGEAVSG